MGDAIKDKMFTVVALLFVAAVSQIPTLFIEDLIADEVKKISHPVSMESFQDVILQVTLIQKDVEAAAKITDLMQLQNEKAHQDQDKKLDRIIRKLDEAD